MFHSNLLDFSTEKSFFHTDSESQKRPSASEKRKKKNSVNLRKKNANENKPKPRDSVNFKSNKNEPKWSWRKNDFKNSLMRPDIDVINSNRDSGFILYSVIRISFLLQTFLGSILKVFSNLKSFSHVKD